MAWAVCCRVAFLSYKAALTERRSLDSLRAAAFLFVFAVVLSLLERLYGHCVGEKPFAKRWRILRICGLSGFMPVNCGTDNRNFVHMVTIRLARGGSKKRPFYHLTVTNSRNARDGRFVERVGFFNPVASGNEIRLSVNDERVNYWLSQGAQPSERVAQLLKDAAKAAA